ncbi:velvet factor-domain-containing protein [Aspergillus similis]
MATLAGPPPTLGESGNLNSVSRITREGKKITYKMSIMQQPKRARACGQGSKSHTDRRPVDPPPVIELNIFESDPHDDSNKTDITFIYNANFFLFATLEPERPIATGKLMTNQGSPVLTGVPVAGVAYLDKPNRAGYFIFPDLSVRNEGSYRFSFHLFEQIKDPKDATEGTQPMPSPVPGKLSSPQEFLEFRLEVISNPFIVYSAKKFPGLTTSTPISRMIAEQGCRVRIRRDVRMRRRGDKRTEEYDYDNERAYNNRRAEQYVGSDAYANAPERPRSTSISTNIDPYSYPSRRPSAAEYGQQIAQPYQRPMASTPAPSSTPIPAPIPVPGPVALPPSTPSPASAHAPAPPSVPLAAPPPLHTPSYQSHLSFGATQTQYPAPQLSHIPQQSTTPTHPYSPRSSISHGRNQSIGEYEPSMGYPGSQPRLTAERPSYGQPSQTTWLPPLRHSLEPSGTSRSKTPSNMITSLPPIQSLSELPTTPSQPSSTIGSSPANEHGPRLWETNSMLSKRTYEESFGHDDRPLYNGMRPDSETYPGGMQRRPSYERSSLVDGPDQMAYKRANGRMHQLHRSLQSNSRSPNPRSTSYSSHSRQQEWSASHSSVESDSFSEVSGQFDDAEEPECLLNEHKGVAVRVDVAADCSPSSHSVKRRRSNDWPRQSVERENEVAGRREEQQHQHASGTRQRWFGHYGRHASPGSRSRSPRHARPGRRSRFVEGHMADTVSEKPPSIFFPDEARNETTARGASTNRGSGIFRFGKAIASAFNPFGGWGSVSEIWKGPHAQDDCQPQERANDRLRQAEMAYEELKRSGYQGTAKGSYIQSLGAGVAGASLPDQTWKSIQEKMEHGSAGGSGFSYHSRQSSCQTATTRDAIGGSSLRPMFPDLRKAKSSLAIPSVKKQDGMSSLLQHIDNRDQEVRRQKSRKDMQRQAKLLKRVSNLEDKLERAKRELRELAGEEELLLRSSLNEERPYQRRFVPGTLPSLPSERLLQESEPALQTVAKTPQIPEFEDQTQICVRKTRLKSPKPWRRASESRSISARSASRKRKSPDPESRKEQDLTDPQQQCPAIPQADGQQLQEKITNSTTGQPKSKPIPESAEEVAIKTPSRKPKLPKNVRSDSPGSVEQKQKQGHSPAAENNPNTLPAADRASPSALASRPLRSTTRNRSVTPVLRMKRGRGDLRSTTSPGHGHGRGRSSGPGFGDDKENQHCDGLAGDELFDGIAKKLGQQPQQQDIKPAQHNESAVPNSTPTPTRRKARYEYIPPVPPLPKDLAVTAAKVDRRLAREMGKRKEQMERDGTIGRNGTDGFQWPEEFF